MRWLWLPGIVLILAGGVCSISFFRYYDDAEYLERRAREIELQTGDPVRAAPQRSLATQARISNLLWGSGMGVGVVGGVALIVLSIVGRRPSRGGVPSAGAAGANPEAPAAGSSMVRPGAKLRKVGFYLTLPYLTVLVGMFLVQTLRGWEPFAKELQPILIAISIPIALCFMIGVLLLVVGGILWLFKSPR